MLRPARERGRTKQGCVLCDGVARARRFWVAMVGELPRWPCAARWRCGLVVRCQMRRPMRGGGLCSGGPTQDNAVACALKNAVRRNGNVHRTGPFGRALRHGAPPQGPGPLGPASPGRDAVGWSHSWAGGEAGTFFGLEVRPAHFGREVRHAHFRAGGEAGTFYGREVRPAHFLGWR